MKAIARDRRERYPSAAALADDVERFLAGDPVEAAPPSRLYLLKTFANKYRTAAFSVMTVVSLLLIAALLCSALAISHYRTNQRLEQSNKDLFNTIAQLRAAEETIRAKVLEEQYEAAISMAFMRFDLDLVRQTTSEPAAGFLANVSPSDGATGAIMPSEILKQKEDDSVTDVSDDLSAFADHEPWFPLSDMCSRSMEQDPLLQTALFPIRVWSNNLYPEPNTDSAQPDFEPSAIQDLVPAPEMTIAFSFKQTTEPYTAGRETATAVAAVNTQTYDQVVEANRDRFFRHLLTEYRRAFGEEHARVAEAQNLLAACLIEMGKLDEAESRLRESIMVANPADQLVAKKLLKRMHNQGKDSPPHIRVRSRKTGQ